MDSMDSFRERFEALEQRTNAMATQTRTLGRRLRWWQSLACGLVGLAVLTWALPVVTADDDKKDLEERVAALEELLKHFRRDGHEVFIEGANLHIVNGLGQTDCGLEDAPIPNCPNGLGNLIVGYNEPREGVQNIRTGSHNVVVGKRHHFTSFGGLVVGDFNEISGPFASVSGGASNIARGRNAAVLGGHQNTASGFESVVSGGQANHATESRSMISGGAGNLANGAQSMISGGLENTTSGQLALVSGGQRNEASGFVSSVSGGENNEARGELSSVSGGENNLASGIESSISGGKDITVDAEHGWAAGSIGNEVTGSFRSP